MSLLSGFVLRHKAAVALVWLVALLAGGYAASNVSERLSRQFSFPGAAGYEANVQILRGYGNGGPGNPLVPVVTLAAGSMVDSPGVRAALRRAFAGVAGQPGVRVVSPLDDPRLVAADRRTAFGVVYTPFQAERGARRDRAGPDLAAELTGALRAALPAGTTVEVTGLDELPAQVDQGRGGSLLVETLLGGVGALLVLVFVFGSLLALVPLLVAAVSITTTFLLIIGLTEVTDVNFLVQYLVALIGLGVAVDYSLIIVTRWREERSAGHDRAEAVRRAMATAGRAVVLSALTVAVGLTVLVLLPVPFLRSVGYGGMLIPLVSTLVSLTLLPVLLATVGPRLDWPRLRTDRAIGRGWRRWAVGVVRRPKLAAVAALAVLVPLSVAAFGLRLGQPPADSLPGSGPAHDGLAVLGRAGVPTGVLSPIEILLPASADWQQEVARLRQLPGVYAAIAPTGPGWQRDGTALVTVLPVAESGTQAGKATVERVRATATAAPGVVVGGSGTQEIDATHAIYRFFPVIIVALALVTLVLLARAFRSVLLAVQATVANLLSVGAAYGVLVLVWQHGYGSNQIWGIPATGSVAMWVPLMTFAFLFGLSMDYEVFLLARMREEYDVTGSTRAAVVTGLGRVGRLITSAALILFLAFAALASLPDVDLRIMATGLGAGILLDATILRALLVPALIALGGRRTWALPARLARLLRVSPAIGAGADAAGQETADAEPPRARSAVG